MRLERPPTRLARSVAIPARVACLLVVLTAVAHGAPRPELIVMWAPGLEATPVLRVAAAQGVPVLDRAPLVVPTPSADPSLMSAIEAFERLRLDEAWSLLEQARAIVDTTGGGELSPEGLADLFLYRALVRDQRGDTAGAWDELVLAAAVAPARVLDAARFPPRVVADHERARLAVVGRPRGELAIRGADGCRLLVDGAPATATTHPVVGVHWVHVACKGVTAWGARVTVTEGAPNEIVAKSVEPPSDDELLVVARSSGARAFVTVVERGEVVWVAALGADGREHERRAVAAAAGSQAVAAAVAALMRPPSREPWFRRRWVWAAGAAGVTAAIILPLAFALAGRPSASTVTIVGPGGQL